MPFESRYTAGVMYVRPSASAAAGAVVDVVVVVVDETELSLADDCVLVVPEALMADRSSATGGSASRQELCGVGRGRRSDGHTVESGLCGRSVVWTVVCGDTQCGAELLLV